MAKARRKSTVDKAIGKANDARALKAEFDETLRRFAQSPETRAFQERLSTARAKETKFAEERKLIDRALAIEAGWIAPPWMKQLATPSTPAESSGPKTRKAPQVDRARRALRELYPPEGRPPDEIATATLEDHVAKHLKPENKRLELPAPSWHSVLRARRLNSK